MKKIYILLFTIISTMISSHAATQMVTVSNNVFTPSNFTITVGDTVIWMWSEGTHSTTSTNVPNGASSWDQLIDQNNQSFTYIVTTAGTYNYLCTFHYQMGMVGQFTAELSSGISDNIAGVSLNLFANPINSQLQVYLRSAKAGEMTIVLNDITGREIKMLASGNQSAGEHHLQYNLADLPKGMYLLKLTLGNDVLVRKIIL